MDIADIDLAWAQEAVRIHNASLVLFLAMPDELQRTLYEEMIRRHLIFGGQTFTDIVAELRQLAQQIACINHGSIWSHPDIERLTISIQDRAALISRNIAHLKAQLNA